MRPEVRGVHALRAEVTPATLGSVKLSPIELERFDEYVVVAKLGQGGMAEVFLALSPGPQGFRKLHVIKRLHRHMHEEPELVRMFLHEAALAARLHHPNVVQTNKVGSHQGQHFLAMEYLDGQPLNRVLKRLHADGVRLPPALCARIAADALAGLDYAHHAVDYDGSPLGIVHRDVSPHNIFVTYDGQVKLLDFGIAKASSLDAHTRTGLIKGKCSYIAPEQTRGELVDLRADLWSMGVTLWECLSGERPFRGETDIDILRSTLRDEIPLLSEVMDHVPEALAHVLSRALQRDRERRIASAQAFREQLEAWLVEQGPCGSHETLSSLMQALFADKIEERRSVLRFCLQRVGELQAAGAFASATGALAPATSVATPAPSRPLRAVTEDAPPAKRRWLLPGLVVVLLICAAFVAGRGERPLAPEAHAPPRAVLSPVGSSDTVRSAALAMADHVEAARPAPTQATAAPTAAAPKPLLRRAAARQPVAREPEHDVEASSPALLEEPRPKKGRLVLDSAPYAVVFLGERRLGITPIDVELTADTHTLTLKNPEQALETTYRVTIAPGEVVERRVALE